jgi:pyroglutamyl-peptidase
MTARILLTGFEPFGGHAINPSERVLRPLAAAAPGDAVISTRVLPVSYRDGFLPVRDALDSERFDAVLLLGLGAGRGAISFERVAVNRRGSPNPDNDGIRIDDERIDPAGPAACFSTVPVDELIDAVLASGAPGEGSEDAGTFLCNQVLYQTLRHCDRHALRVRAGFVHLPLLPEQATGDEPALVEPVLLTGLAAALEAIATLPPPEPAGAE